MSFSSLWGSVRSLAGRAVYFSRVQYRKFRALRPRYRYGSIALVFAFIIGIGVVFSGNPQEPTASLPSVTLASVAELSGNSEGVSIFGTVRARSEATIFAETGGRVVRVHTALGSEVPAGFILAELENASEAAAVLQAEGAYDAARAAQSAVSLSDEEAGVESVYRSTFTDVETALENQIDLFFAEQTAYGPRFVLSGTDFDKKTELSRARNALTTAMRAWRAGLETSTTEDPLTLLTGAETVTRDVATLLTEIAKEANRTGSNATAVQLAALASARGTVDGTLTRLANARSGYRAGSVGATASGDASVKSALGNLRAAQATLEKTRVRAPFAGTVNFLPLRPGDYVVPQTHVATVAQNQALEIVANISEENRLLLEVGKEVRVDGLYVATITSIAPALNPQTKQVEVRFAASAGTNLINGQSVRIMLASDVVPSEAPETAGPVYLPLASVKLEPDRRVVFIVNEEGRLIAVPVETGDVRGGKIEIVTALDGSARIVTDARGLSEGDRVNVAEGK